MARQWTEADSDAMDSAAGEALAELDKLFESATPGQRRGMQILRAWVKAWYLKAGYKRLMRGLLAFARLDALIAMEEQK